MRTTDDKDDQIDDTQANEIANVEHLLEGMIADGTVEEVKPGKYRLTAKGQRIAKRLLETEKEELLLCIFAWNDAIDELMRNRNIWTFVQRILRLVDDQDFWLMKRMLLQIGESYKDRQKVLGEEHWKIKLEWRNDKEVSTGVNEDE